MSQIIINGGNPLKDCPTSWDNACLWESAANAGRTASESPTWKWDCGFKLDYDGPVLSFCSRFYPPKTHYGSTWDGSVTVLLLGQKIDEKDFDCETLHELRTQVEAYRDQWVARLRGLLVPQKEEDELSTREREAQAAFSNLRASVLYDDDLGNDQINLVLHVIDDHTPHWALPLPTDREEGQS